MTYAFLALVIAFTIPHPTPQACNQCIKVGGGDPNPYPQPKPVQPSPTK